MVQVSSVVDQREAERRFFTSLPRHTVITSESLLNSGGDVIHGSGNPGPSRRSHEDSLAASNLDANGLFRLSFLRNPEMPNVCYSNSVAKQDIISEPHIKFQ